MMGNPIRNIMGSIIGLGGGDGFPTEGGRLNIGGVVGLVN